MIYIRQWNSKNSDEREVYFTKSGDTLEFNEVIGSFMVRSSYKNDTITYKYYLLGNDDKYRINEWLVQIKNGKPILEKSEYLYSHQINDSIYFKVITYNLKKIRLVMFEKNDTLLQIVDTIFSESNEILKTVIYSINNKK